MTTTRSASSCAALLLLLLAVPAAAFAPGARLAVRAPTAAAARQRHRASPLLRASAEAAPEPAAPIIAAPATEEPGATILASALNLVKTMVGSGALSLPFGIAAASDKAGAVYPAVGMVVGIGMASAYGYLQIVRACQATGASTYEEAWAKSVNAKTAPLVKWAVVITCASASLAYSIIIGETLSSLAAAAGGPAWLGRRAATLMVTVPVILPLCLLRSLASLSATSFLGTGGVVFTMGVMLKRLVDGSYAVGGPLAKTLAVAARPTFGAAGGSMLSMNSAILLSMLGTSYLGHFGAAQSYRGMKNPTVKRAGAFIGVGFFLSIAMTAFIAATGFLTFGGSSAGLVLNNYATTDPLVTSARAAIAVALITGFPLVFAGLRDGVVSMRTKLPAPVPDGPWFRTVAGLLGACVGGSLLVSDVGLVVSLTGALLGAPIIFVFPALMHLGRARKAQKAAGGGPKKVRLEDAANVLMAGLGVVLGGVGATVAVLGALK